MAALRTATVGISLCDAETSVAAPMTSKEGSPLSVITTLRHCRCSLATAYSLVGFNVMYAFIQLNMMCNLYSYGLDYNSDNCLVQDLFYAFIPGIIMSQTREFRTLDREQLPERLMNRYIALKVGLQLVCYVSFQLICIQLLEAQSWYVSETPDEVLSTSYSYLQTTLNAVALSQLVTSLIVSTIGAPFQQPWYRNTSLVSSITAQVTWVLFTLFMGYNEVTSDFLQLKPLPRAFSVKLVLLIIVQTVVCYMCSRFADSFRNRK